MTTAAGPHEKTTFCRICEPQCSLIAEIDGAGKVRSLRPDRDHPIGSVACHKGLSYLDIHHDPDRVNWPLRRQGPKSGDARFCETSWEEAMRDIGDRLRVIRERHGPNSVAVYHGNAFAMCNSLGFVAASGFIEALQTEMLFNSNTQDASNKVAGAAAIYGSSASLMVPDLLNTDYLLCIGANPCVSRWVICGVPNDDLDVLREINRRGGKVRFVNPRRIESSTPETGPTLQIRPGSDVYFLAAVLNEIERLGGIDLKLLAAHGKGVEPMFAFVRQYPADHVAGVVGLSADEIRTVAAEMVAAPSAAVYSGTGLNMSGQGMLGYWLTEMINFATGNLGRRGGTFKPTSLLDDVNPTAGVRTVATSIGTFELAIPVAYNALPLVVLPDLIEAGDIKALIVLGGNPLLTGGGEEALRRAAGKLDLMVSVDIYRQATADLSDYILPSTDWLEHADLNFMVNGYQLHPYVQYADPVVPPFAGRRNGWWILARLLQAAGLPSPLDENPDAEDGDMIMAGMLAGKGLTIDQMRERPSNTHVFEQRPHAALFDTHLVHPDRKIDCYPALFVQQGLFERCADMFERLSNEPADTLKLISLRTRYMQNTWLANVRKFRHGPNTLNPLHVSDVDARARGWHEGDLVRMSTQDGSVTTRIVVDADLRPGVVAMTHGYGHSGNRGLTEASRKPGANCNAVMPTARDSVEPISYMSWISGVPVEVSRVDDVAPDSLGAGQVHEPGGEARLEAG